MAGDGLSLVMHDVVEGAEEEFHPWYRNEFMAKLLVAPGVLRGRRFRVLQGKPKYLAIYELEDTTVPNRPEFYGVSPLNPRAGPRSREMGTLFLNRIRGVYQRVLTLPDPEPSDLSGARALLLRGLEIDPGHDDEFQDWYSTEHVSNLSRVPGVLRVQRYRLDTTQRDLLGNPPIYLAVYDLERPEVQASDEWRKAIDTPWTARMRHFYTDRIRNLYEQM